MKIKEVRAIEIDLRPRPTIQPRSPSRSQRYKLNRPVNRYPKFRGGDRSKYRFRLEAAGLHRDRGGRYLGLWDFTLRARGCSADQRLLRTPTSRRKPHGHREIVGHDGAPVCPLRRTRYRKLCDQRGRLRAVGSQGQGARPPRLRTVGRAAEGRDLLLCVRL